MKSSGGKMTLLFQDVGTQLQYVCMYLCIVWFEGLSMPICVSLICLNNFGSFIRFEECLTMVCSIHVHRSTFVGFGLAGLEPPSVLVQTGLDGLIGLDRLDQSQTGLDFSKSQKTAYVARKNALNMYQSLK